MKRGDSGATKRKLRRASSIEEPDEGVAASHETSSVVPVPPDARAQARANFAEINTHVIRHAMAMHRYLRHECENAKNPDCRLLLLEYVCKGMEEQSDELFIEKCLNFVKGLT